MKAMLLLCALLAGSVATAAEPAPAEPPLARMQARAEAIRDELIEIRRQIHMHPEISGTEEKTAALVARRLAGLGLDVRTGVGGHGVVAILRGGRPGPVVAYRADMDAVPSMAVGDQPYKSKVPGVKHVCGHDAHVAVGLGVAEVLTSIRDALPGTVKLIFQPAEENVQGARAMIEAGVLEDPAPQAIFAVHTVPLETGKIACPLGVGLTGWEVFQATIEAESGAREVAVEIAQTFNGLSTVEPLVSPDGLRSLVQALLLEEGPYSDFVYLQFSGPTGRGVKGDRQVIRGQIRAAGDAAYARARRQIEQALKSGTEGRAQYKLEFGDERFPDMHSDAGLVRAAIAPIEAALGTGSALTMHASAPYFGEDFALFQQHIPGAMFFLGVANAEKRITALNHFPDYDIDESAIELGTVAMANVLLDYLERHAGD